MKEKEFMQNLLKNNRTIHTYYDDNKRDFLAFAYRNFHIDEENAADIYQESFIILYENLRDGKYKEQHASLKHYLFGIFKRLIYKYLEKRDKNEVSAQYLASEWIEENCDDADWLLSQEAACKLVHEVKDACGEVLKLFYFEKKSMAEIALAMNYSSEQVAKNKKGSCIDKLTITLRKRLKDLGIYWREKE